MKKTKWFDRKFAIIEDNGIFPCIIERLAGTPARLEEMTKGISNEFLEMKPESRWSVKEEAGHLADLEPLWTGRIEDLINREAELRAADLSNRRTHEANHNSADLTSLQNNFRQLRNEFISQLSGLTDEQMLISSLHPRLKTPMRAVDLAYFVAEHDDQHLSSIRELKALFLVK